MEKTDMAGSFFWEKQGGLIAMWPCIQNMSDEMLRGLKTCWVTQV
jgi:hypothetical protein